MENINKDAELVSEFIKKELGNTPDLVIKELTVANNKLFLLFVESVSDGTFINDFILEYLSYEIDIKKSKDLFDYLYTYIPTHKCNRLTNIKEIYYNLLSGFTIILVDGFEGAISIETKSKLSSGITEAVNERSIHGPKDAFVENYQENLGLIRKRIKSKDLRLIETDVGYHGNSKVGLMYMDNIADVEGALEIFEKIKNINIDAVFDVQQVIELISGNEKNVFPNYLATERPDYTAIHLLEGRIVILLENTPYVAIVPAIVNDFTHNPEDTYSRTKNITVNRVVRFLAFLITLIVPAIYIAMTSYNHETIPAQLLINFSVQRDGVPFSTIIEALLMILTFEILRETDARSPSSIASSLSIVGALVLGEAAVIAGVVSPIMVIVIAITSISGLIMTYPDVANAIRIWRIVFLIGASISGFVGVLVVGFIFIANVSSIKSFGTPYLSGYAPFVGSRAGNSVILTFYDKYMKRGKRLFNNHKHEKGDENEI